MATKKVAFLLCSVLWSADRAIASECPLKWNDPNGTKKANRSIPCPYGRRLPGDITLPNNASFVEYLSVIYGYVPFVIVGLGVIELLLTGPLNICTDGSGDGSGRNESRRVGTRELSFVAFCIVIIVFNEIVLKNMVRSCRPERSCNYSCGFPSGHSTMAVGFFSLMFLDGTFRVFSKMPLTLEEAEIEQQGVQEGRSFRPSSRGVSFVRFVTIVPLSKGDVMSHIEFVVFAVVWACMLLPVPASRLALQDHTPAQIFVGSAIGAFEAAVWFYMTRQGQYRWNKCLGKSYGILKHNYPLPRYYIRSQCVRLLSKCVDATAVSHLVQELEATRQEIEWYVKMTCNRQTHIIAASRFERRVGRGYLGQDLYPERNFLEGEIVSLRQLQHRIDDKLKLVGIGQEYCDAVETSAASTAALSLPAMSEGVSQSDAA